MTRPIRSVLIVSDDKDTLAILAAFLDYAGYRTVIASLENEFVPRVVEIGRPDAIVLDLALRQDDALELLRTLCANAATKSKPIIGISSSTLDSSVEEAAGAACEKFVAMRFDPSLIIAALEVLLDG